MPRTKPYWVSRDGTTRHWARFDGIYRTRNMQEMWMVIDTNAEYLIVKLTALKPFDAPVPITVVPYGPHDFAIACRMAESLAKTANRVTGSI